MNNNGNKPKLELQLNIPCKIKLLQDTPATGESSYGRWFLFNVNAEDQDQSFFAPEQVVKFILDNDLKKNSELLITKKIIKNGKKNITDFEIKIISTGIEIPSGRNGDDDSSDVNKIEQQTTVHNTQDNNNGKASKDYTKMLDSMREALKIKSELGDEIDSNKIGVALFIQKCRS
jgi:hypothetical protein